jgi:hypothetical protein
MTYLVNIAVEGRLMSGHALVGAAIDGSDFLPLTMRKEFLGFILSI